MCVIVANIMEQCSLFLPLQRGAGPMALMLIIIMLPNQAIASMALMLWLVWVT
jgi:hypothetical protein